jgi:hypothetical protein
MAKVAAARARAPKVAKPTRVGGMFKPNEGARFKVKGGDAAGYANFRRNVLTKAERKEQGPAEVKKGGGGG